MYLRASVDADTNRQTNGWKVGFLYVIMLDQFVFIDFAMNILPYANNRGADQPVYNAHTDQRLCYLLLR